LNRQKVVAVCGVKNAGKTTFLEKLIPALARRGVKVAVVKHDGHRFSADREGTDTFRMLSAGAMGAAVFDGEKFQAVKYAAVTEKELVSLYPEAELILLEGLKNSGYPKIEIIRGAISGESVCRAETLLALVTDTELAIEGVPTVSLEDAEAAADILCRYMGEDHAGSI